MNPIRPLTIKRITCYTKGCRNIYDVLIKTKQIPSSQAKWRRDLTTNIYFIYDIPFSCTKDPKLQWLQHRINHRILGTNYLLVKMGIKNSEICSVLQHRARGTCSSLLELYSCGSIYKCGFNLVKYKC